MNIKTILLHVDPGKRCPVRIRLACALAIAHRAHLVGLVAPGLPEQSSPGDSDATPRRQTSPVPPDRGAQARRTFEMEAIAAGVTSFEALLVDDDVERALARYGRLADLVIIGQDDSTDPDAVAPAGFADRVMLGASHPLLVVPAEGAIETTGKDILVGWDTSRSAARALTDALPFLMAARRVRIVRLRALDQDRCDDAMDPGLVPFLARHGVAATVIEDRTPLAVGDALVSRAADYGCDLLVMGGYGHSRLREAIIGGVTRTVLDTMTVPVLFSCR